jgi:hypothetical protein
MKVAAVIATLLLIQAGCRWNPGQSLRPPGKIRPPGEAKPAQQGTSLGRKTVASKEPPGTLIAADGSSCIVPEKQFAETVVGTSATCLWTRN